MRYFKIKPPTYSYTCHVLHLRKNRDTLEQMVVDFGGGPHNIILLRMEDERV